MAPKIIQIGKFRFRKKMAIFDYDWTLVRPKSNGTFSRGLDDWTWLTKNVPNKIVEFYKKGYCIAVISNQTRMTQMKIEQIVNVMTTLDIPSVVAIGFQESDKKPNRTMFDTIVGEKKVDFEKSIFVGDALGRSDDFSDSDKQFALNIGITKIFAPDDIFAVEGNQSHNRITQIETQEIIVMVGYPGSGKSTIANSFDTKRYKVISGDEYGNSKKMIKAADEFLHKGLSVIFDATNPTREKRKEYIEVAMKYNIPVRCIVMKTDLAESMFRNNKRNKVIPKITYYVFRKKFEEPTLDEGFVEIIAIE